MTTASKKATERLMVDEVTSGTKTEVKNGNIIITIPILGMPIPSRTSKSTIVATTRGNVATAAKINGKHVNIFAYAFIES